jgi:ribosome biogenesis GTPase A
MSIPSALLPPPPSWYPGHMAKFARMLPALLSRTDVVLELRDSRLPLTSINNKLEGTLCSVLLSFVSTVAFIVGALQRWRAERGSSPSSVHPCERIVVLNKRDLVPEWGMEVSSLPDYPASSKRSRQPFQKAMKTKFPDQRVIFASWNRPRDIRALNELLVSMLFFFLPFSGCNGNTGIAKSHPETEETNVLVMGMPNVGKSTLLNALRNVGIPGRECSRTALCPPSHVAGEKNNAATPKAFQTSAHPGLTRVLSTRLKLCESPRVYSYDSPGVMLPFFGRGDRGAERGVKLALIGASATRGMLS